MDIVQNVQKNEIFISPGRLLEVEEFSWCMSWVRGALGPTEMIVGVSEDARTRKSRASASTGGVHRDSGWILLPVCKTKIKKWKLWMLSLE